MRRALIFLLLFSEHKFGIFKCFELSNVKPGVRRVLYISLDKMCVTLVDIERRDGKLCQGHW